MLSGKLFRPLRPSCTVLRLKLLVSRTMASGSSTADLLINDAKYSWLKELGLQADNPGVFDGTWHANGPVSAHHIIILIETMALLVQFLVLIVGMVGQIFFVHMQD